MTSTVLKWSVPVDDREHPIGVGPVVLVACQNGDPSTVYVWTEEVLPVAEDNYRRAQVFGTRHDLPEARVHLGSTVEGSLVWHLYEVFTTT